MKQILKFLGFGILRPNGSELDCNGESGSSPQVVFEDSSTEDEADRRIREKENEAFLWGLYPLY